MNPHETDQAILEARKKMAEKFGNLKIGGKGKNKSEVDCNYLKFRFPKKKGRPQTQIFSCSR